MSTTYPDTETAPAGHASICLLTCLSCWSSNVHVELRDAHFERGKPVPPRNAYGCWIVCQDCRHEWPSDFPPSRVLRPPTPEGGAEG